MKYIVDFGRFWYDFIIGDDWMIAVMVAAALVILKLANVSSLWWLLPVVVIAALGISLWRVTRAQA